MEPVCRFPHKILTLVLFFTLSLYNAFGQESTLSGVVGLWTDNTVWTDGTAPGTTGLNVDVSIYGRIQLTGDLGFNNGDLNVYDTLIVIGNLTVGNNSNLTIYSGGVLIVLGDYTQNNQADISTGGTLVVTGNFTMVGSNNQGSFDVTGGSIYILDPTPSIKTGSGYTDLQCTDPSDYPDNCAYGDYTDLQDDPIFDLVVTGSYSITASGPTSFCAGGSVILSTTSSATSYQWYRNAVAISGATSFNYTATQDGSYTVSIVVGGTTFNLNPVVVTVLTGSVAPTSVTSDRNNICAGDGNIVLSYSGGTMGNGATAQWYSDAALASSVGTGNNLTLTAPQATTTYYVRFEGDCNNTAAVSVTVTVHALPAPLISGDTSICESGQTVNTVSGDAGSTFVWSVTGGSITGSTTGNSVTVDWSGTGTGVLTVEETTVDGCLASGSLNVEKLEMPVTGIILSDIQLTRR